MPAAADGIRIVHEVEPSGEQFRTARHLLARAERICFLGFGYDPVNVGRFKLPSEYPVTYWGSVFGMGRAEIESARGLLPVSGNRIQLGSPDQDCFDFLREVFALW